MKRFTLVTLLACLAGCQGNAIRSQKTNNKDFEVEVLFTDPEGYTVKRFKDGNYYRYYVTPGPATVSNDTVVNSGKTTTTIPGEIQTVGKKEKK